MKKYIPLIVLSIVGILTVHSPATSSEEVQSLRTQEIKDSSEKPFVAKPLPDQKPFNRSFKDQPPLIPHSIDDYTIEKGQNSCLDCHDLSNYESSGATKISPSHYIDRNGKTLTEVSSLRYFCTQCHVTQADVEPLIENTFQPTAPPKAP